MTRVLAKFQYYDILSIATKYSIQSLNISVSRIKYCIWMTFSDNIPNVIMSPSNNNVYKDANNFLRFQLQSTLMFVP